MLAKLFAPLTNKPSDTWVKGISGHLGLFLEADLIWKRATGDKPR